MKRIICRIIERVFPDQVKRIRETNRARRTAIQAMLDASRFLRRSGSDVNETNRALRGALNAYELGEYESVGKRTNRAVLANG